MLSSAHRSDRAKADGSSASRARSERIAVCTGWARIAYGREEEHERDLVGDGPALDAVADHDRGAEEQPDHRVLEHRPPREPHDPAHVVVVAAQARDEAEARPPHRDGRDADERRDAEGPADREDQGLVGGEVDGRVGPGDDAEHEHASATVTTV